jgi:hypothetical protein
MLARRIDSHTASRMTVGTGTANAVTSFSHRLSVLAPYEEEYSHAMRPGWADANAIALTRHVINLAEWLIDRFGTTDHLTEVAPGRDGSLSFVWDDQSGNYIYLDVGPGDTVHLYRDTIADGKWEAVSVAADPRILAEIDRAFRGTHWPLYQRVIRLNAHTRSERAPIPLAAD